jgi:molybdopterin converting factor small subunit
METKVLSFKQSKKYVKKEARSMNLNSDFFGTLLENGDQIMTREEFEESIKLDNDDLNLGDVLNIIPEFSGEILYSEN